MIIKHSFLKETFLIHESWSVRIWDISSDCRAVLAGVVHDDRMLDTHIHHLDPLRRHPFFPFLVH